MPARLRAPTAFLARRVSQTTYAEKISTRITQRPQLEAVRKVLRGAKRSGGFQHS